MNIVICSKNHDFLHFLDTLLTKLIIKKNFQAEIVLISSNLIDVLEYINTQRVDIVFLDIDFKIKNDGIEFAKKIREIDKNLYLIFITNYIEYAFSSFRIKPFDFLTKPITEEKLENLLSCIFEDMLSSTNHFMSLSTNNLIKLDDVCYISRVGMKLVFMTKYGFYDYYSSFNKIEPKLPNNFVRSHKSYIVNINKIESVNLTNKVISFGKNTECYIGLKYKSQFLEVMNDQCIIL